jgi:hypothetical protein
MSKFKEGDYIISDLDLKRYRIIKFGPRNELTNIAGVNQLGNCAIVQDLNNNDTHILMEWEMDLSSDDVDLYWMNRGFCPCGDNNPETQSACSMTGCAIYCYNMDKNKGIE